MPVNDAIKQEIDMDMHQIPVSHDNPVISGEDEYSDARSKDTGDECASSIHDKKEQTDVDDLKVSQNVSDDNAEDDLSGNRDHIGDAHYNRRHDPLNKSDNDDEEDVSSVVCSKAKEEPSPHYTGYGGGILKLMKEESTHYASGCSEGHIENKLHDTICHDIDVNSQHSDLTEEPSDGRDIKKEMTDTEYDHSSNDNSYRNQHVEHNDMNPETVTVTSNKAHNRTRTEDRPHFCLECNKTFKQKAGLKRHMVFHTGEHAHLCTECNKTFTQSSGLNRHMLIHRGVQPHVCSECNKSFTLSSNLSQHMLTHTGVKSHVCPECNRAFSLNRSLTQHMLTHTGDKPYVCPHCDRAFAINRNLKQHMLIHTGVKAHACPDCDKSFTQYSSLRQHLLTHTGNNICPVCDKAFISNSHLKQHSLTHTGDKPHVCPECIKTFATNSQLTRHRLIHKRAKYPANCEDNEMSSMKL